MAIDGRVVLGVLLLLSMLATPAVSRLGWVQPGADDSSNVPLHDGAVHLRNRTIEFLSAGDTHGRKSMTAKVRPIRGRQNATHMVDLQVGLANSIARAKDLQRRVHSSYALPGGREAQEWGFGSELGRASGRVVVQYLVHGMEAQIGLTGEPASTLVVDTGSSLVWVQCDPCVRCYPQVSVLFKPAASASYAPVACEESICKSMQNTLLEQTCVNDQCMYRGFYGDGTQTSYGGMGVDQWLFADDPADELEVVVFGCGSDNNGGDISGLDGVLGLDRSELSLISQFDNIFSQCFLPFGSPASFTLMEFGAAAYVPDDLVDEDIQLTSILVNPARPKIQYLYVGLIDIAVNNVRLNIPQGTFSIANNGAGGTIVDSGNSFSVLVPVAYDALKARLLAIRPSQIDNHNGHSPCWLENAPGPLPTIALIFSDSVMFLDDGNAYVVEDGYVCLAIETEAGSQLNIIGNWQMSNQFMLFETEEKLIKHAPYDCSRLAVDE